MACRNTTKAGEARDRILADHPHAQLDVSELDLSRLGSVREFATRFRAEHDRLDLLMNNAGMLDYSGRRNEDGMDLQLVTNHLGHFLLTARLFDLLPDTPETRVVSLSSVAHKDGTIAFDDINCENPPSTLFAYAQSKLACLMFANELDRRLRQAGRRTLAVCAHPGGTDSGLFDDAPRIQYWVFRLIAPFITHSNENAARSPLYAALANDVKGGEYIGPQGFKDLKGPPGRAEQTDYAKDPEIAAQLWAVSEDMVGERFEIQPA